MSFYLLMVPGQCVELSTLLIKYINQSDMSVTCLSLCVWVKTGFCICTSIFRLKKDVKYNYSGPRTREGILEFANRVGGWDKFTLLCGLFCWWFRLSQIVFVIYGSVMTCEHVMWHQRVSSSCHSGRWFDLWAVCSSSNTQWIAMMSCLFM